MFATQNHAFKIAEQFAAQQRAKEIALKGHSKIEVNNKKVKRRSTPSFNKQDSDTASTSTPSSEFTGGDWAEKQKQKMDVSISRIEDAVDEQHKELDSIEENIQRQVGLSRARLNGSANALGACLSMKHVKRLQEKYVLVLRKLAGLKELENNLRDKLVEFKDVDRLIKDIVSVECKTKDKDFSDDQLLKELKDGMFYPTLKGTLQKTRPSVARVK